MVKCLHPPADSGPGLKLAYASPGVLTLELPTLRVEDSRSVLLDIEDDIVYLGNRLDVPGF